MWVLIVPAENDIIRAAVRCRLLERGLKIFNANKIRQEAEKNAARIKKAEEKARLQKKKKFWKELTKIIKKEANKGCSYVCLTADKYLTIPAEEMWDTLTKQGYWFDNIYTLKNHSCSKLSFICYYGRAYLYIHWDKSFPKNLTNKNLTFFI